MIKAEDLIQKYLGLMSENDFNEKTLKILANCVDLNKDGLVFFIVKIIVLISELNESFKPVTINQLLFTNTV